MKVEIKDLQTKHFRFRKGAATVVYKVGIGGVDYAVAFCSTKDTFSKKAGRQLAANRFVADNCTYCSWASNFGGDVATSILMDILSCGNVPNKLRPGLECELSNRLALKNAHVIGFDFY